MIWLLMSEQNNKKEVLSEHYLDLAIEWSLLGRSLGREGDFGTVALNILELAVFHTKAVFKRRSKSQRFSFLFFGSRRTV